MRKKRKIKINTYPSLASRLWHRVRFHQEQKPDLTVSNDLEKMEEATSYAKISCRKLASRTRRRCTKCRNRFCSSLEDEARSSTFCTVCPSKIHSVHFRRVQVTLSISREMILFLFRPHPAVIPPFFHYSIHASHLNFHGLFISI